MATTARTRTRALDETPTLPLTSSLECENQRTTNFGSYDYFSPASKNLSIKIPEREKNRNRIVTRHCGSSVWNNESLNSKRALTVRLVNFFLIYQFGHEAQGDIRSAISP